MLNRLDFKESLAAVNRSKALMQVQFRAFIVVCEKNCARSRDERII